MVFVVFVVFVVLAWFLAFYQAKALAANQPTKRREGLMRAPSAASLLPQPGMQRGWPASIAAKPACATASALMARGLALAKPALAKNAVCTGPGAKWVQVTPVPRRSCAMLSDKLTI